MRPDFTNIKTLQDTYVLLLNSEFLSDIKFKFNDGRILFAHSFVLCCRSNGFCDSFETTIGVSKLIEVDNFSYEEYYEFLKYLYTDECTVDHSNAESVIQLSTKHDLAVLETKCTDLLMENISVDNACTFLMASIDFELEKLKKETTKFIAENYLASLNTDSFLELHDEALKTVLELSPVSDVDEFKIFEAAIKWPEQACLKSGLKPDGNLKRDKLGNNLKRMRFGAMTPVEFTRCNKMEPGLLTKDEIISIFMNSATGETNPFGFMNEKRLKLELRELDEVVLCGDKVNNSLWMNIASPKFEFSECKMRFSVSHPIAIEGVNWLPRDTSMIRLIETENGKTIYEGPDLMDLIISKQLLQANTWYTFYLTYSCKQSVFLIKDSLKFKSQSGKCEFTIYKGSSPICHQISFEA